MGTDDEIVQLNSKEILRKSALDEDAYKWFRYDAKLNERPEVRGVVMGAFFVKEIMRLNNINIHEALEHEIIAAAHELFPDFPPFSEPYKAGEGTTGKRRDGIKA